MVKTEKIHKLIINDKKNYIYIYCIIFISCNKEVKNVNIQKSDIKIELGKNHLFLSEYNRKLIILQNNIEINNFELQNDVGIGCNSYLFESNTFFILVDCNSKWLKIYKKSNKIEEMGYYWNKIPNEKYIGTFLFNINSKKLKFIKEESLDVNKMYLYGGG